MYFVEGNIGAGKSTFINFLKERIPGLSVYCEPLDEWQKKINGQALLDNFYKDPVRWSYSMENYTLLSRVRDHLAIQKYSNPLQIIERSVYSGYYCFALNGYQNKFMLPPEWRMHCSWFNFLVPGRCLPPKGFIYLKISPEVSYKRLKERAREEEMKVSIDYLRQLHKLHEDFLIKKEGVLPELIDVPVLVLDGNLNFKESYTVLEDFVEEVEKFFDKTSGC